MPQFLFFRSLDGFFKAVDTETNFYLVVDMYENSNIRVGVFTPEKNLAGNWEETDPFILMIESPLRYKKIKENLDQDRFINFTPAPKVSKIKKFLEKAKRSI